MTQSAIFYILRHRLGCKNSTKLVLRTVMTSSKDTRPHFKNYNKSHIYCNYKQYSLYAIFLKYQFDILALCDTYIYISRVHTYKVMKGDLGVGRVVQDDTKKISCISFIRPMTNTAHHKHFSVVVLYLKQPI